MRVLQNIGIRCYSAQIYKATFSSKIFQDKIREVRNPLLAAEDVVYMKALEADDSDAKTASVAKKKAEKGKETV